MLSVSKRHNKQSRFQPPAECHRDIRSMQSKNMTSSTNRKYVTYRNVAKGGLTHARSQSTCTKSLVVWFLRYASGETDRQKNKHPYSSQYFAGLHGAK